MVKRIPHMGMTPANEEHDRWHREPAELSPKRHAAMLKKLGVTPEQDAEWHRTHKTLQERRAGDEKSTTRLP